MSEADLTRSFVTGNSTSASGDLSNMTFTKSQGDASELTSEDSLESRQTSTASLQSLVSFPLPSVQEDEESNLPLPQHQQLSPKASIGAFLKGDHVHVWSNTRKRWFNDGIVAEIVETTLEVRTRQSVRQVLPGSLKVRFDKNEFKWIESKDIMEQQLRRVADGEGCGWREMRPRDLLPDRVVCAGKTSRDGRNFVACNDAGEPGKLDLEPAEDGQPIMGKVWCPEGGGADRGQVLVLQPFRAARWWPVRSGEAVPAGAVQARAAPPGQSAYVARNGSQEAGKLLASGGQAEVIWCHGAGRSQVGEVLILETMPYELEVEVLKVVDLAKAKYRPFDKLREGFHMLMHEGLLVPYLRVSLGEEAWESGCRRTDGDEHTVGERCYFAMESKTADSLLTFSALDKRRIATDALIAEGTLSSHSFGLKEVQTVELERDGRSCGRLFVKLRLHGVCRGQRQRGQPR